MALALHLDVHHVDVKFRRFFLVPHDVLYGSDALELNAAGLGVDGGDFLKFLRGRSATHFEFDRL